MFVPNRWDERTQHGLYLRAACAICRCSFQTGVGCETAMSLPPSVKISTKIRFSLHCRHGGCLLYTFLMHACPAGAYIFTWQNKRYVYVSLREASGNLPSKSWPLLMKASRMTSLDASTTHWCGPEVTYRYARAHSIHKISACIYLCI